jgi:hypothetical protein
MQDCSRVRGPVGPSCLGLLFREVDVNKDRRMPSSEVKSDLSGGAEHTRKSVIREQCRSVSSDGFTKLYCDGTCRATTPLSFTSPVASYCSYYFE